MIEVVGSSPVIGKDFPHFSFFYLLFFNVQTALCIIYDKKLFDKKKLTPNNCKCFVHAI